MDNGNGMINYHGVHLKNPNLQGMEEDNLYHFALGTKTHNLKDMFGDVKFVVVGGSPRRIETFAHYIQAEIGYTLPAGHGLQNIAKATDRYVLYKIGPVLAASHGMGIPSVSIMLHEIFKLLRYAQCTDVVMFRIGTCGGVGLKPGTVVISEETVNELLKPELNVAILGKVVTRPALLDPGLVNELLRAARADDGYDTVTGKTMCTSDFYEGQGRLDGAFCDYIEADKMAFLREIYEQGVRNIEMESVCFAAMCHHAGVKAGVACVALLNRLEGDQVNTPQNQLKEWGFRPSVLIARFIKQRLGIQ